MEGVGLSFILVSCLYSSSFGVEYIYDPQNGTSTIGSTGTSLYPPTLSDNTLKVLSTQTPTQISSVYGSFNSTQNVNNNVVEINSPTSSFEAIIGGFSSSKDVTNNTAKLIAGTYKMLYGGLTNNGNSVNNSVIVSGENFTDDIIGGEARGGKAVNNSVNIIGNATFTSNVGIAGGYCMPGDCDGSDRFSGNTLNIAIKNINIKVIENFEWINFYLPSDIANNDKILSLSGTGTTDLTNSKLSVAAQNGVKLNKGDKVILIENDNGITAPTDMTNNIDNAKKLTAINLSSVYTFDLSSTSTQIVATATSSSIETHNEAQKALVKQLCHRLVW